MYVIVETKSKICKAIGEMYLIYKLLHYGGNRYIPFTNLSFLQKLSNEHGNFEYYIVNDQYYLIKSAVDLNGRKIYIEELRKIFK